MNLRDFGQRLIPTGEQSGLLTRIAATGSVSFVHADEKLTASGRRRRNQRLIDFSRRRLSPSWDVHSCEKEVVKLVMVDRDTDANCPDINASVKPSAAQINREVNENDRLYFVQSTR